jgi:precorrin-6Y C5,15-methyltransferase (decarboxylating)
MSWLPAAIVLDRCRSQWRDRPGVGHFRARTGVPPHPSAECSHTRWWTLHGVTDAEIVVVGIGVDGWSGLADPSRTALREADVIVGGSRHLELLPADIRGERRQWPSPLLPALPDILDEHRGRRLVVLASGDPMFYGIGSTLSRLGGVAFTALPHSSSVSLACARLGWAVEDVEVVSLVGRPLETLHPAIQPGRRVLVLLSEAGAARGVAGLLTARGYGASELTVLTQLGGSSEQIARATAAAWDAEHDPLGVLGIECRADAGVVPLPRLSALPDEAFETDGQLTKRELRAMALAGLAPVPGELLWDVGAGSGSIGIEWMRAHPANRGIAIEPRDDRRAIIANNAAQLGVPGLEIVAGSAPDALATLAAPDAVFVGGGVSVDGVIDACVAALRPGGRLIAHGVTVETESVLAAWHAKLGGTLARVSIQRAEPLGSFTTWRPALPVTQWSYLR